MYTYINIQCVSLCLNEMKKKGSLYAINKNGVHKEDERETNSSETIANYVRASLLSEFLSDEEFMKQ